ncbi:unnamed protein product [Clonostachys solani]|uniref:IPT/TIG domain-containing protein n=1 Tax=Clonostachys solani TaxID=160281 RepID=A0A9N9ZPK9_9HYPO|nr:unnamed protein product [Clonostachys solani]
MSPAGGTGSPSPYIAGTDDPIHGARFNDSFDDAFAASEPCEYNKNSPDTLQSLDTSRKGDGQSDLSTFEFTGSPNDGSFHEYSSDSAESSKREEQTPPEISDAVMDGILDPAMEWPEPDSFDALMGDDTSFITDTDASHLHGLQFDFVHDGDSNAQQPDFLEASNKSTITPAQTMLSLDSPGTDALSIDHQRHNSNRSREVSPMANTVTSHQSTPSALFQTPSPGAMPEAPSHSFLTNGTGNPKSMWGAQASWAALDSVFATNKAGMNGVHPQAQQTYHFGSQPLLNPGPPRCELVIKDTPAKSRVETQIRLLMVIKHPPPGITKLHLPTHTISKPKLQVRPPPAPSPDMLELSVSLVCTSALAQSEVRQNALRRAAANPQRYLPPPNDGSQYSPQNGAEVRICENCMGRERKRAARKKVKQIDAEKAWADDEAHRVVVFNTNEVREWKPDSDDKERHLNGAMVIDCPTRIACYCRHHGEKMGFNIIFTMKDYKGRFVAQTMSPPIMITDDHKTAPLASLNPHSSVSEQSELPALGPSPHNGVFHHSPQSQEMAAQHAPMPPVRTPPSMSASIPPRVLSRPASPSQGGRMAKKRKSSTPRVPNELAMTKLEHSPGPQGPTPQSGAVSPFHTNASNFPQPEPMFAQPNGHLPFAANPPTPGSTDQTPFFGTHRSSSMDNLAMAQLYSAPPSNHASRAPSPNGLRNGLQTQAQAPLTQTMGPGLLSMPINSPPPRQPHMIHKVIPNEGPRMGGAEVTILGTGFFQGLDVYFGNVKAVTTTFWGESSLVCLLPPSPVTGLVPVTCQHSSGSTSQSLPLSNNPVFFRYIDDSENQLMRLALQCVGGKLTGGDIDVSALARQLIDRFNAQGGGSSSGDVSSAPGGTMYSHTSNGILESQLLKCLDVIDLDDSPHKADLDRQCSTGQTMLHLASSMGFHRFVAALIARGANPNALDNGHFTPLHIAALHNQPDIVRRLILAGASTKRRSLSGLVPIDMAKTTGVSRAIRLTQRHTRSLSGGSIRSRTSSAGSLQSLWEPLSRVRTHDEPLPLDSGEESLEYTSGDFEDEDPDEDTYLTMRRPSALKLDVDRSQVLGEQAEANQDPASQANALGAALKEQVQQQLQQFQQTMALHLQNLPQFPQIPQMPALPGMPMLPDYQAYLQPAPFMRRMTQYMPGMSGGRPESEDGSGNKVDHRWWDLSSYRNNNSLPPPSYEEIFPEKDLDVKQASALHAAVEAEADMKCATIYDQASSSTATTTTTTLATTVAQEERIKVPSVLKIGRKNAITKEQQEQLLRAREERLKRLSNDRNLFFIWIPLLLVMVCAMIYSYFPSLFPMVWSIVSSSCLSAAKTAHSAFSRLQTGPTDRGVRV